jgi:protein required for attachment to host cells
MSGRKRCIVVADGTFARILLAEPDSAKLELVEHSELENCSSPRETTPPSGLQDASQQCSAPVNATADTRKRVNVDQQFATAIAHHVRGIVRDWTGGDVVIAAAPETLAMLREVVQQALPKELQLKALAKNYVSLSAPEIAERFDF